MLAFGVCRMAFGVCHMGAYLACQSRWISGSAKDGNGISFVDDALVIILVVTTVSNDLERELEKC
jgi:hypothetical protein